jgi:hypothetical protein
MAEVRGATPAPLAARATHYVVCVVDEVEERLAGRGCSYTSPPQPHESALELVRILRGCAETAGEGPWHLAIAGGRSP